VSAFTRMRSSKNDGLAQEFELAMRVPNSGDWPLVPGIDLETVFRVWKCLEFMAILDLTALRRHQSDSTVVYNSLMRVAAEESLMALLKVVGVAQGHVPALLDLIAAHVGGLGGLGHYDIQYRPFLRAKPTRLQLSEGEKTTPEEIFHASGIFATSNIMAMSSVTRHQDQDQRGRVRRCR